MQLFLRGLSASTRVIEVDPAHTVAQLQSSVETLESVPTSAQVLLANGRALQSSATIGAYGLSHGSTVHLTSRLCGGVPTKVKIITPHLSCGPEVTIDIEASSSKDEIKQKLVEATGVPFEHQKVMLSGINQIVMGDKRTNIGFASCGSANGVQMAVNAK